MEKKILEAAIAGRTHYEELVKYKIVDSLSDTGQALWNIIDEYYKQDSNCDYVDRELLKLRIDRELPKHKEMFNTLVDTLEPSSPANLLHEIRCQKTDVVKMRLAAAFASDKDNNNEIEKLMEEWERLIAGEIEHGESSDVLIAPDLEKIMGERSAENRITVYPDALNSVLDQGLLRGHHVVVFAPTDMGKTLFTLNMVRGFIENDLKVLYVGNEDPISDLIERFLVCFTGRDKWTVRKHWKKAQQWAEQHGWDRLIWAELSPGTLSEIRSLIEKHQPDVLVVDQIRNLDTGDKNFVRVLEVAAQGMRNFAKKYQLVAISVTQAGDSASGKKILSRGDIDNSNVGIPGTADLMLGIGADENDEYNGVRTLSFPKNKVSGNKRPIQVMMNMKTMRVE